MAERRFTEDEVAEIFARATESQHVQGRHLPSNDGMTLAQLQEIGREVGLAPELVANAARSLDVAGRPAERKLLGFPIGVGRTVELPRKLTEDEWERLVVDLRETFDARGNVRAEGSLRSWNNGNLQALLEPTSTGQRLRLKTLNGSARSYIGVGAGFLVASIGLIAMRALGGDLDASLVSRLGVFLAVGAGMIGLGAVRLPSWARLRRQQMEDVAKRLVQSTSQEP